jgi:hypothetical protein
MLARLEEGASLYWYQYLTLDHVRWQGQGFSATPL